LAGPFGWIGREAVRVTCVGGGPAGLYFAILMKRRSPNHDVIVLERNPFGQTYGWGVVYWDDLLANLVAADPESARAIREHSFRWEDQVVRVGEEEPVRLEGHGYSIGRQRLLSILTERAVDLGVQIHFDHEVGDASQLPEGDLTVLCDGVHSRLRSARAAAFGPRLEEGRNRFIWLGTRKVFENFTFPFVETNAGWIWFHGYGFDERTSTCIVECSPETWTGLGFDALGSEASLALLGRIFERHLDGQALLSQTRRGDRLPWLQFQTLTNESWRDGTLVLMGDAAHTAHFTIGSGTRLAMEDAIALAAALHEHVGVGAALEAYETERKAALHLPQRAARNSARWFENLPRYIDRESAEFAMLLDQRVSRILPLVPPGAYFGLHKAARTFAALRGAAS
jgi:2-polyprenyl-6-methoxyphenol hydroxylase-like FAD-dependent oxidoreductase